jgi:hypothetical protein
MEQMIWFLRIFSGFALVLAIAIYSRSEISLAQSTTSSLKFEPATKLILQSYGLKLLHLPSIGEVVNAKLDGEDIKMKITEMIPNEKITWEITNLPHTEKETVTLAFSEKENLVQISFHFILHTKSDFLSRLLFLFFGKESLKNQSANWNLLLAPHTKP